MEEFKKWKVGVYIRLSVEDSDKDRRVESNSIINQRDYIDSYIKENKELKVYDYYVDDGFTGTNLHRPSFERLIKDIQRGKVNAVIIKDLSRLGRNYLEVGKCIEEYFQQGDVRLISINDNIDSYKRPGTLNSIYVPLRNIINDEYSRDISNKVRSALYARMKNGEYVGSATPFGYIKDPKNKRHLVPVEEEAKIIKMIFEQKAKDIPSGQIAKYLNDHNIKSPRYYYSKHYTNLTARLPKDKDGNPIYDDTWTAPMIAVIVRNPVYCGDLVQGKRQNISYKIQKSVATKPEERIIVKNTHTPIIDRETFDKIKERRDKVRTKPNVDGEVYMFSGYLRCADCGRGMSRDKCRRNFGDDKKRYYFSCNTYRKKSPGTCTPHKIFSDDLEEMVLKIVQVQMKLIVNLEENYKKLASKISGNSVIKKKKKRIEEIQNKIEKQERIRKDLYLDWKNEIITKNEYMEFSQDCSNSIEKLYNEKSKLNIEMLNEKDQENTDIKWINKFKQYNNIKKLDREIIEDLIERVFVHEDGNITVKFKFDDEYERLMKKIEKVKMECGENGEE